jgi:hypothetical protein
MTEAKRKNVREAIRAIEARFEFLRLSRGVNPPMFASKGLVSLATVLHLLAQRHLDEVAAGMVIRVCLEAARFKALSHGSDASIAPLSDEEKPDGQMSATFGRYIGYCQRFMELSEEARHSVQSGELVIRSPETGAKLRRVDGLNHWLAQEFDEDHAMRLPTACAYWQITSSQWPDCLALPPGGLLIAEAEAWAVSSGVAQPGELLSLIGAKAPDLPSGSVVSVVRPTLPPPERPEAWTPERLANRQSELKSLGVRDYTKRLEVETGLKGREIRRRIEALSKGGAMGSIAGQLCK